MSKPLAKASPDYVTCGEPCLDSVSALELPISWFRLYKVAFLPICLYLCPKDANLVIQLLQLLLLHEDSHMVIDFETTKELPVERLCQQADCMSSEGTLGLGLARLSALGTAFEQVADLLVRC